MKIEFEGRTWQLDTTDVDMEQALVITGYTGLSLMGWEKACIDADGPGWLKAIRCLYWLMRAQNGEPLQLESVNFAVLKFLTAWSQGGAAEAPAVAEPDPTKPAGGNAAAEPAQPAASLPG